MSPLPVQFTDRWGSQRTAPSYADSLCWHILLGDSPGARAAAREAQRRLARFGGFQLTPQRWLHMSVMLAGTADKITPAQRARMPAAAGKTLAGTPPVTVTLERVFYSPEGIALGVTPAGALAPLLDAARTATMEATSQAGSSGRSGSGWTPHVTIGYSTGEQQAAPVIAALGKRLTPREVTVRRLSLVVQNGPEDLWDWHVEGFAELSGQSRG
jgi:2'-5' RNA ligase